MRHQCHLFGLSQFPLRSLHRLLNQPDSIPIRDMSARLLLRVHQLAVHTDLVTPAARWDQDDFLEVQRKMVNQGDRQTGGARGVASDDTEFDRDLHPSVIPARTGRV